MHDYHNNLPEKIWRLANKFKDEIVTLRRTFHQYPELSWKEFKTGERIASILSSEGFEVRNNVYKTTVVAELKSGEGGKIVAIRADMDGLPMYDAKDVTYASRVAGVMHACGHDAHMAIAIGVAKLLKSLNLNLPGKVRFIFQPSEEAIPSGAEELVRAGVIRDVDGIFAFHVDPEISGGKIGLKEGLLTAYCSEFKLTILGKSGHAARPHHSIDTIFLTQQVLSTVYDITGKRSQQYVPAVLTIGKIEGGTKANVIPERVDIFGTIRTIDEQTRNEMIAALEQRVYAITKAAGGSYQLEFLSPVPSVLNDPHMVNMVREVGTELLTHNGIVDLSDISMGGEDFSWYLTKAPGVLIRLGAKSDSDKIRYLHTHDFDIDERAIPVGVAVMSMIVVKYLLDYSNLNKS